ncbi:SulP family inorganic anion transporter, partial [Streptomyces sp. NPDC000678]
MTVQASGARGGRGRPRGAGRPRRGTRSRTAGRSGSGGRAGVLLQPAAQRGGEVLGHLQAGAQGLAARVGHLPVTDTRSGKTRESIGQGIANIVTGFFGGMGGCAMIGQTMINVRVSGARTRLSTFLAGS